MSEAPSRRARGRHRRSVGALAALAAVVFAAPLAGCSWWSPAPRVVAGASGVTGARAAPAPDVGALLKHADAAYDAGERDRAEALYRDVLDAQPNQPRALFRLGQLAPRGSTAAIERFRRYVSLVPRDPWGAMALGDALAHAGDADGALAQYEAARRLAPGEREVADGTHRILRDAGRVDALIEALEADLARRPDVAAWRAELGRALARAGRHEEAAAALRRAHATAPNARTRALVEQALADAAPSLRPYAGRAEDSDDNRITRLGIEALVPAGTRTRIGVLAERADVADPFVSGTADHVALVVGWRPRHALRVDGAAGVTRLAPPAGREEDVPTGHLRLRWRGGFDAAAAELHVLRQPLVASTPLLAQPVELSEARGMLEVPFARSWAARVRAQGGQLAEADRTNRRSGARGSLVHRFSPVVEVQATAGRLAYQRGAGADYFAPRRVDAMEVGTYFEVYALWPVTLAVDAGAGRQRIEEFGAATGTWRGTFRVWSSFGWDIAPGWQLAVEVDRDNSQAQGTAAGTSAGWRSTSVLLSLRSAIGRRDPDAFLATARDARRPPR
jgi:tetratricopeptide (TPR) repeat protein